MRGIIQHMPDSPSKKTLLLWRNGADRSKVMSRSQHCQDMIDMENTAIMFSIAKNLAIIVLINHFMALC
eukprot:6485537-Amphidinium_carterae.1